MTSRPCRPATLPAWSSTAASPLPELPSPPSVSPASDHSQRPRRAASVGDSDQLPLQHQIHDSPHGAPRISRSNPIAIQLPPRRRGGPIYTPPEPLSARGDVPGGYFPFHEHVRPSYKPHPFDDATTNTGTHEPESPFYGHTIAESPVPDYYRVVSSSATSAAHFVSASVPMVMSMPLGKYHPSNYKNKDKDKLPALSTASSSTTGQQRQHSQLRNFPSDVRKKLKQYRRDIVEQAAIAGGVATGPPKPPSPQLRPLRSPGIGPMTPMDLEYGDTAGGGYLAAKARVDVDGSRRQDVTGWTIEAEGVSEHEDADVDSNADR